MGGELKKTFPITGKDLNHGGLFYQPQKFNDLMWHSSAEPFSHYEQQKKYENKNK